MSKTISHLQKPWALASTFWSHEQAICKTHLQQPKIICNSNIVFNIDILVEKEYVASPEKRSLRLILVGRRKKLKWWRSCRRSYYVFHPTDDIFFFTPLLISFLFFFHFSVDIHFSKKKATIHRFQMLHFCLFLPFKRFVFCGK